jgi:hypothetical protein
MGNMERYWMFVVLERSIAILGGVGHTAVAGIEPCTGPLDWLTGCGDTVNSFLAALVLGTVTGAPDIINFVWLGIVLNGLFLIGFFKWGRGVNDQ